MKSKPNSNRIINTDKIQRLENRVMVKFLRACGYPLRGVRKALFCLNCIDERTLGIHLGIRQQTMNKTSLGQRRNPEIQRKIAEAFNVPVDEMFPPDEEIL